MPEFTKYFNFDGALTPITLGQYAYVKNYVLLHIRTLAVIKDSVARLITGILIICSFFICSYLIYGKGFSAMLTVAWVFFSAICYMLYYGYARWVIGSKYDAKAISIRACFKIDVESCDEDTTDAFDFIVKKQDDMFTHLTDNLISILELDKNQVTNIRESRVVLSEEQKAQSDKSYYVIFYDTDCFAHRRGSAIIGTI